jgi:hypothetical protein
LFLSCLLMLSVLQTGCKAKSCPNYIEAPDDDPRKRKLFRKKQKTKSGVYDKKTKRKHKWM